MWERRIEHYLFAPVTHVFRHLHPAMKAMENPQIPAWAEVNKSRVLDALRLVDRELATKPFIAGASNSVLVKENVTVSDSYEVTAELPGMDPSNITVKFSTGTLTIKGEKKEEKEEKGKDYVLPSDVGVHFSDPSECPPASTKRRSKRPSATAS